MTPQTTLTTVWLTQQGACQEGVDWFKARKVQDASYILRALIHDNKLPWANWLIVRVMARRHYLAYAIYAAEQVLSLYEQRYPQDSRPRTAIEAAKACLKQDTKENREAARTASEAARAAWAACESARTASEAAWDDWIASEAARAAWAACESARAAKAARTASEAARTASEAARAAWAAKAAWAASEAARTASEAAWAASEAAWAAMHKKILAYGMRLLKEDP